MVRLLWCNSGQQAALARLHAAAVGAAAAVCSGCVVYCVRCGDGKEKLVVAAVAAVVCGDHHSGGGVQRRWCAAVQVMCRVLGPATAVVVARVASAVWCVLWVLAVSSV